MTNKTKGKVTKYVDLRRYNYLVTNCYKLSYVAEMYGVSKRRAARDFKFWCELNGLDPYDFYVRSYLDTGYWVPPEFVKWWGQILAAQGLIATVDKSAIEELKKLLDEFTPRFNDIAAQIRPHNSRLAILIDSLMSKLERLRKTIDTLEVKE